MNIIFFGLGSIGKRHAQILIDNYDHQLYAFRSGKSKKKNSLGITEINSWKEINQLKPQIAFITNPTSLHIQTAIKCAQINCKLFIEKPIGSDLKMMGTLLKIVKEKNLVSYIAYNIRFHPVIIYLKKYLKGKKILHSRVVSSSYYPNWRIGRNYLNVYSARTDMGGGVILDLSHEFDYIFYLFGEMTEMVGKFARRDKVTVDAEDYADILVKCDLCPVNIHINFLSQLQQRYIQVDCNKITIIGNLLTGEIFHYQNERLFKKINLNYDRDETFKNQLKYFFDNINNPAMMNNIFQANSLFKKIITFRNKK